MSFFGKKYRRTGGSNLDDFFKASKFPEHFKNILMSISPVWSFTLLDEQTVRLEVHTEGYQTSHTFTLGVEHEVTRPDGTQSYMTVTLEGDNVLLQRIRKPSGRIAYFKREFHERTATMTVTMEGADDVRRAHIFYELVD